MDILSEVNEQVKAVNHQIDQSLKPVEKIKKNRLIFYAFIVIILFVGISLTIFWRNRFSSESIDTSITEFSQFKTQIYSFSYPTDWMLRETTGLNGEYHVVVLPKRVQLDDPSVYITAYKTLEELEMISQLKLEKNYKKSMMTLTDGEATVWYGSRKGSMFDVHVQEKLVIFTGPDRFFTLTLRYQGEKPNEQYEKLFSDIIATFKLQK